MFSETGQCHFGFQSPIPSKRLFVGHLQKETEKLQQNLIALWILKLFKIVDAMAVKCNVYVIEVYLCSIHIPKLRQHQFVICNVGTECAILPSVIIIVSYR